MIEIHDLTFSYKKKNKLFTKLKLTLQGGRIYGLLGKNGAGKTTLLHLISGLLFPEEGKVTVLEQDPGKRTPYLLQNIFFLPEEVYIPSVSPLKYADMFSSFYPNFELEKFLSYLREFEIDNSQNMSNMSMGQRKKSIIAFALACNVQVLLMDEPTNGLDIPSKKQFRKLIASVMHEKLCIVISTHQIRDLDNLLDSVLILNDNRIIFNKNIEEIAEYLYFTHYNDPNKLSGILYKEEDILGGKAILENPSKEFSPVDMELLFNGVIANGQKIDNLFTNNSQS